jgi:VWFA-related protein
MNSRIVLSAWLALAACTAFAQEPRLVTLNLTATDADGHAVTGLAAGDIKITDQGKPVAIASFRQEGLRTAAPAAAEVFTNRPPGLANVHVVLFDILTMAPGNRQATVDLIVKALEPLEKDEAVYLYVVNPGGELVAARPLPAAAPIPAAAHWAKDLRPMLEKAMGPITQVQPIFDRDVMLRIKTTLNSVESLAGRMAGMPGRKTITWITNGVPRTVTRENGELVDLIANIRQSAGAIDRAGVTVNPVSRMTAPAITEHIATLQEVADVTGGKLYQGGDVERAVAEGMEAARSSYRVQYAPGAKDWDGKFHKVHATTGRKGVTLQYEQGYNADKQAPAKRDRAVEWFGGPFDTADIGLRATLAPGTAPHTIRLSIAVDGPDIRLEPRGERYGIELNLQFGGYLPDGRLENYAPVPISVSVSPEQREKGLHDAFRFGQNLTVNDATTRIRMVVEDRLGGGTSTLTIPLMK